MVTSKNAKKSEVTEVKIFSKSQLFGQFLPPTTFFRCSSHFSWVLAMMKSICCQKRVIIVRSIFQKKISKKLHKIKFFAFLLNSGTVFYNS